MRSSAHGPLRLAFIGQAGSGKSTQARLLQAKYKGDVLSFATPLKKVTRELFGDAMDDPTFARKALQVIGTDAVRAVDINTWVRLLVAKVPESRNVFVDDLRFYNEYVALRSLGFHFVRLLCAPEVLHTRRPTMTVEQYYHASEQEIAQLPAEFAISTGTHSIEQVHDAIVAYLDTHVFPVLGQSTLEESTHASPADIPYIVVS